MFGKKTVPLNFSVIITIIIVVVIVVVVVVMAEWRKNASGIIID